MSQARRRTSKKKPALSRRVEELERQVVELEGHVVRLIALLMMTSLDRLFGATMKERISSVRINGVDHRRSCAMLSTDKVRPCDCGAIP